MAASKRRGRSRIEALEPRLVLSAALSTPSPAAIDPGRPGAGSAFGSAEGEHDLRTPGPPTATGLEAGAFKQAGELWGAVAGANFDRAPWAESGCLTYSIVPDGADVGGVPNTLDAALNARGIPTDAWQAEVHRAAATWAEATGLELTFVPDDGSPLGTFGPLSGNPRFGDIRIVGMHLPAVYAAGTFEPPPSNWGTESGDIVLNVDQPWDWGDDGIDFRTVLIHEFGHALGAGHVEGDGAALNEHYEGIRHGLSPADLDTVPARDGIDWSRFMPGHNAGQAPQFWYSTFDGAGDEETVRIVVDRPGLFVIGAFEKDDSGDAAALRGAGSGALDGPGALVPASGRIALSLDGLPEPRALTVNGMSYLFLEAGEYEVRALTLEASPPPLALVVTPVNFVPETLRLNGIGQAGAARMQLIGPGVASAEDAAPGPIRAVGHAEGQGLPASADLPSIAAAPRADPLLLSTSAVLFGRPENRSLAPSTGPSIALLGSDAEAPAVVEFARGQAGGRVAPAPGRSRSFSDVDPIEAAVYQAVAWQNAPDAIPNPAPYQSVGGERSPTAMGRLTRSLAVLLRQGRELTGVESPVLADRSGPPTDDGDPGAIDRAVDEPSQADDEPEGQGRDLVARTAGIGLISVALCRVGLRRRDRRRASPRVGRQRADPSRDVPVGGRFAPSIEPGHWRAFRMD